MNEPHDTGGLWHKVAQYGVDGVREVDSFHPIYVSGDSWGNSQLWPKVNPIPFVNDPRNLIVYEAHLYLDDDFSGTYKNRRATGEVVERLEKRLNPFLNWLKIHNQKGAIGEFGIPMEDSLWLPGLQKFLEMSDAACLDWFMWAGGSWRPSYELSLEPIDGIDRPQIRIIRNFSMSK
jgi:endoglucanase